MVRMGGRDKAGIREIVNRLVNEMSDEECRALVKKSGSEVLHEAVKFIIYRMLRG